MNREEKELLELIKEIKEKLPFDEVKSITEYNEHNEWGLAFETLCIHLYEYSTPVSFEFYEKLVTYGKSISAKPRYWERLKELVK